MSYDINHAFLADKVYENIKEGDVIKNNLVASVDKPEWTVIKVSSENSSGYQGALLQNKTTGEYVFASRGTEILSLSDLNNDRQMALGQIPEQMAFPLPALPSSGTLWAAP
jgi:hypothetical protein